jgi:membrane protease YdiL (CAAX protease family)
MSSDRMLSPNQILGFVFGLGVTLILCSWGLIHYVHKESIFQLFYPKINLGVELMVGVGLGVFLSITAILICNHIASFKSLFDWVVKVIFKPLSIAEIFIVSALVSFAEELFFRGAIQPLIGILPTSIIFAVLHMGFFHRLLPYGVYTFLLSLILGYLFMRTGSLLSPISCHFSIDFMIGLIWKKEKNKPLI